MSAVSAIGALSHGWPGLALGYATVQGAMLTGMARARAAPHRLALSPPFALAVTAAAGTALALAAPLLRELGAAPFGLTQLAVGAVVSGGFGYAAGRRLAHSTASGPVHRRGARLGASAPAHAAPDGVGHEHIAGRAQRPRSTQPALRLAGVPVSAADETKHFKIIGTTGTGKSTAIAELLGAALARGDRAVIADPDGGYLRAFMTGGAAI